MFTRLESLDWDCFPHITSDVHSQHIFLNQNTATDHHIDSSLRNPIASRSTNNSATRNSTTTGQRKFAATNCNLITLRQFLRTNKPSVQLSNPNNSKKIAELA